MPIFNQSSTIAAPVNVVAAAIEDSVAAGDRFMAIMPPSVFIVLRGELGYMYLLRGQGESTTVRLVVDTAGEVRHAFRGVSRKEGVKALLHSPGHADAEDARAARDSANMSLLLLKRGCENPDERFRLVQAIEKAEDDAAAPGEKIKRANPWNPALLFIPSMLTSWFLGGYLYAFNWRRFGKTSWMWSTLGITVLLHTMIAVVGYTSLNTDPRPWNLVGVMIGLSLCNMLLVLTLNSLQNQAYQFWRKGRDVLQFRYHILRTVLAYLLLIGMVFGGAGAFLYYQSLPKDFESQYLDLIYSSDWQLADISEHPSCQQAPDFFKCVVYLQEAKDQVIWIVIIRVEPAQPMTANQLNDALKADWPGVLPGLWLNRTLDGMTTASHLYNRPAPELDSGSAYGVNMFVARGGVAYMLSIESPSEQAFRDNYGLLDDLLETLKFTWDG